MQYRSKKSCVSKKQNDWRRREHHLQRKRRDKNATLCLPFVKKNRDFDFILRTHRLSSVVCIEVSYVYAVYGHPERKSRERLIVQL